MKLLLRWRTGENFHLAFSLTAISNGSVGLGIWNIVYQDRL